MKIANSFTIVVKISKFCNLRCSYCYEFAELNNRARMRIEDIGRMFSSIRCYIDANPELSNIRFAWAGGEPLLIKPEVYGQIAKMSRDAFADSTAKVSHVVQTNLTVLSPVWLTFLKDKVLFDDVGISFDAGSDQRVDVRGRLRTQQVLGNMRSLIEEGIDFAAIAVMSRRTLPQVASTYRFYDALNVHSRFLPYNASASADQADDHGLSNREIVEAFIGLFDQWLTSPDATSIEPLGQYLEYALNILQDLVQDNLDVTTQEGVFAVNPDGETWGVSDLYTPGRSYGNMFKDGFGAIVDSPARGMAMDRAQRRFADVCGVCPHLGACPGYGVAFAMPEEHDQIREGGCMVRAVIDAILQRLDDVGLASTLRATGLPRRNGALAIPF